MANGRDTLLNKITNGGAYDAGNILESKGQRLEFYHVPSMTSVNFKAILKTYNETYTSNWTPVKVLGRNDPIQSFQGTERSISLAWEVVAFSLGDQGSAENNMAKCSTLARMLYPQYQDITNASTISKAPLIKLRFSNLIYDGNQTYGADAARTGLLGVITNLTWTPNLDAGFLDPDTRLYPKVIDLSLNYSVLHQHPLGWQAAGAFKYENTDKAKAENATEKEIAKAGKKDDRASKRHNSNPQWMGGNNFPWGRALSSPGGVVVAGEEDSAAEDQVLDGE
tara:strand:- start:410 stop:1252 length:843 start_codon:yes stop_codon:yes gene_type:complete